MLEPPKPTIQPVYLQGYEGAVTGVQHYVLRVGDRRVGFLNPARTVYYSHRKEVPHYSFKMRGYGIARSVVDYLDRVETLQFITLVIQHADGRRHSYVTPAYLWFCRGRTVQLSPEFEPQVFLTFDQIRAADERSRRADNPFSERMASEVYPAVDSIEVY